MTRSALLVVAVVAGCGSASTPATQPVTLAAEATPVAPPATPPPATPRPPVAAQRPHAIEAPGGTRNDPYYWLRDDTRKSPEVIGFLEAENAYTRAVLGPDEPRERQLLAELTSHIAADDVSAPVLDNGYWYAERFAAGQEQPVVVRRKATQTAPEEVVLDGNELAQGHPFYALGGYAVSRDGQQLAWVDDMVGRRQFVLHIKNLRTGVVAPDTASNVQGGRGEGVLVWANDNQTVFFVGKDPTTLRSDRVFRHRLGAADSEQVMIEPDGQFYVSIAPTKSRRYIQIELSSTTTSEVQLIDADRPRTPPRVVLPRERDHLYSLDHLDGKLYIRSNAGAPNYRLISVAEAKVRDRKAWHDVIAASPDRLIGQFTVSRHFVAASVRSGGLAKVMVVPAKGDAFFIDAGEPAYVMQVENTPDPDAGRVRYAYQSMVTPRSDLELDVATRAKTSLKVQAVPGYDAARYATEYLHATASDGTPVPVSIVYRKDTPRDGSAPLVVYGYGSYGFSTEPTFDAGRLPLLDRGWVWAIAHVRGGQEMGRAWYDDGHLMHKRNTFTDFVAATEYLVANKLGARDQVYALGGSAGGLLMGAVLNLRPDLYRGVIAAVPFVDVVTTMLDESIPLTTNEFDEWGNPKDKPAYDYMLGYAPYDNVKPRAYPSILVTTGLWDSQVQYFEPAKWVAKLQVTTTSHNPVLLSTDMAAGHGGKSGRFDRLHDTARNQAFLLHVHDRPDAR